MLTIAKLILSVATMMSPYTETIQDVYKEKSYKIRSLYSRNRLSIERQLPGIRFEDIKSISIVDNWVLETLMDDENTKEANKRLAGKAECSLKYRYYILNGHHWSLEWHYVRLDENKPKNIDDSEPPIEF